MGTRQSSCLAHSPHVGQAGLQEAKNRSANTAGTFAASRHASSVGQEVRSGRAGRKALEAQAAFPGHEESHFEYLIPFHDAEY